MKTKVLDGRIFITGKVDEPEEKLKITKIAWETKGARSVRNDIKIKGELTLVVSEKKEENSSQKLSESDINLIKKMINKLSTKEITDLITNNKNISKKVVYNFCLKLKNEN